MLGIYLGSNRARHPKYNIVYQDIEAHKFDCDLGGDMLDVDISNYDFIIATPPCNRWSKCNYRRNVSEYVLKTKHLLPDVLRKLGKQDKPFIVECVRNDSRYREFDVFEICLELNIYIQSVGRHTYFTNRRVNLICKQNQDFKLIKGHCHYVGSDNYRQGGSNVYNCIEKWLSEVVNV